MYTYLVVLKEDVVLNKKVLSYFVNMNFTIKAYYSNLNILKIESDILLENIELKYILSFEQEKTMGLL